MNTNPLHAGRAVSTIQFSAGRCDLCETVATLSGSCRKKIFALVIYHMSQED